MNYSGLLIALITMTAIGVFHPIVIKTEYYFSKNIWPVFAIVGLGLLVGSLLVESLLLSATMAIVGASSLWSIHELFQQEKRVAKGQFPKNTKRLSKYKRRVNEIK